MFTIVGISTIDIFISGLNHLPQSEGDEFTLDNLSFFDHPLKMVLGGNGANTAYILAKLGASVSLWSSLGNDILANTARTWLKNGWR